MLAVVYLLLMLPNPSMLYGSEIERNLWLRSKANSIEGGTSEVQLNIIAKRILNLPGA